jgi:hypothetical protein
LEINRKIMALTLVSAVVFAAIIVIGGVWLAQATVSTSTLQNSTTATATPDTNSTICPDIGFGGMGGGRRGFGGFGPGGQEGFGPRGFGDAGGIEVSSDFTANVTNIAKNDSDVQNLLNSGYNITGIMPMFKTIVDGNGNVATQAATAIVLLENGTVGRSIVTVDLAQNKVTQIETFTRTIITK